MLPCPEEVTPVTNVAVVGTGERIKFPVLDAFAKCWLRALRDYKRDERGIFWFVFQKQMKDGGGDAA